MSDVQSNVSHLTPTVKITDFSVGFRNVKEATEKALYNLKDETSGSITPNALCLDMVPRYIYNTSDECISRVNPVTSLGDIMASLVHLSSRLDVLESEIGTMKKKQDSFDVASKSNQEEFDHMGQHISAMESNLRCLRQTLTFGDIEEDDLPELEGCSLAGANAKQKIGSSK